VVLVCGGGVLLFACLYVVSAIVPAIGLKKCLIDEFVPICLQTFFMLKVLGLV